MSRRWGHTTTCTGDSHVEQWSHLLRTRRTIDLITLVSLSEVDALVVFILKVKKLKLRVVETCQEHGEIK